MSALIVFKSRASADVTMLADTAQYVLAIVGKPLGERGVITVDEMPHAIERLDAAIDSGRHSRDAHDGHRQGGDDRDGGASESVRIDQRAWPVREMLRESLAAGYDVMWGV